MTSPQFKAEDALKGLLTPITGLNVYTTNRTGKRLFPYVTIKAAISKQHIVPYSGVFEILVEINYSDSSVLSTQATFEANYLSIFEALYTDESTLASRVETEATNLKVFMARITRQNPTTRTDKRAWQKGLGLTLIVTPSGAAESFRCYDFSNSLNSFYIATI